MRLDIKKALWSPFDDEKWKNKILILTLFSLSNAVLILLDTGLLSLISTSIFTGYCLYFMHNTIHEIKPFLPNWQSAFLNCFKKGLIMTIIAVIYCLLICLALFFIIDFSSNLTIAILILLVSLFSFLISALYSDNFNFKEAFALRKLLKIMIKAKEEFLIAITIIFGILFVSFYIVTQMELPKFMWALIVNLFAPYFSLLFGSLTAQAYKAGKDYNDTK